MNMQRRSVWNLISNKCSKVLFVALLTVVLTFASVPNNNNFQQNGFHHTQPQRIDSCEVPASREPINLPDRAPILHANNEFIFEGLKKLYTKKVLPLEIASKYSHFGSQPLSPSDFEAKPMVLIIGQYSVGKTSFIRSLLKQDFPGQRIGPEPTTDRFTAIMESRPSDSSKNGLPSKARQLPGHAVVMQNDAPFRGLSGFGNNFLSKFEAVELDASILKNITIIDTPGVLSGEKQRIGRDYDFSEVIRWFAERADMIIIMFDAHKLDISDELKSVLDNLKPHQDKIRVILNKADSIDTQSLLRVYGALMWSLGKVIQTPEVCRVYMGSFWDHPYKNEENKALFDREKSDLLNEMMSLPANAVVRRINELVKRARAVKVHAYIIHYLRKQMPYIYGKSEKQQSLLQRLDREFLACARRYNLPPGDFPPVESYRKLLREVKDLSEFKKLDKSLVHDMDKVLTHDIPLLLEKATLKRSMMFPGFHGFTRPSPSSGGYSASPAVSTAATSSVQPSLSASSVSNPNIGGSGPNNYPAGNTGNTGNFGSNGNPKFHGGAASGGHRGFDQQK